MKDSLTLPRPPITLSLVFVMQASAAVPGLGCAVQEVSMTKDRKTQGLCRLAPPERSLSTDFSALAASIRPLLAGVLVVGFLVISGFAFAKPPKVVCGDGIVGGTEQCDRGALKGMTCQGLGFAGGTLACNTNCTYNTSGCIAAVPVCGDGRVGGYEECDGLADSACPGKCSAHCACPAAGTGPLEVHVIDVGQGDAILVVSPDGFVMLLDTGTSSMAAIAQSYLGSKNITGIDYTLVSHMHSDHMGGMATMLTQHPEVVACFDHGGTYTTTAYDQYVAAAGTRRTTLAVGSTIDLGPSVVAQVLHAHAGDSNENNNSVVVRLTYKGNTILLGGDCEASCEATFNPGNVQVYKVHHHGSAGASSDSFLDLMAPQTALISVGEGNSYGHPTQEALDRLAAHDTVVYRTDLDSDLAVVADGVTYSVNGLSLCQTGQSRSCGLTDVGACQLGFELCVEGVWAACAGAVYPVEEVCANSLDDDCDGLTDTADPDCIVVANHLVISQVGYDTPGDDAIEEFVDLYNPTDAAINLTGWSLVDNASSWALPGTATVAPGAYVSIARNTTGFITLYHRVPDFSSLPLSLANTADELTLKGPAGVVDFVAWGAPASGWPIVAATGKSIERADPTVDTDTVQDWSVTSPAQPRGGTESLCGNARCDAGEDCRTCPGDCPGKLSGGKVSSHFCCGNGLCERVGETATNCALDCH